jgi:hypothetical protein
VYLYHYLYLAAVVVDVVAATSETSASVTKRHLLLIWLFRWMCLYYSPLWMLLRLLLQTQWRDATVTYYY